MILVYAKINISFPFRQDMIYDLSISRSSKEWMVIR